MGVEEIIAELKDQSDPESLSGMAGYGINVDKALGTRVPVIRKIARRLGKNHHLAGELWKAGYRETRILAAMIDDPLKVTEEQVDAWVKEFDSWEVCDQCCMNLFDKLPYAYEKAIALTARSREFEKRAGYALMACLAWHDKGAEDEKFRSFLPQIIEGSVDERIYVKKAVSWALRQIGKRNQQLNKMAIEAAKEIEKVDSKPARWVASDVLREITGNSVKKRFVA